jgi:transcription elongation factor Elf1
MRKKSRRYSSKSKPIKCPKCGAERVVNILYGMPTHEAFLKAQAGKLALGGCVSCDDDPEWWCLACNTGIHKEEE